MKRPSFLIDAFTNQKYAGNQAAVCLFEEKLNDSEYQKIASEFNLSETAYPVPLQNGKDFKDGNVFSLRWFTPATEVPLCGHATLATSHVLFNEIGNQNPSLTFKTLSGDLMVKRGDQGSVVMDFPQYKITSVLVPGIISPYQTQFPEFEDGLPAGKLIEILIPLKFKVIGVTYASEAKKLLIILDPELTRKEFESIDRNVNLISAHPDGAHVKGVIVTSAPKDPQKQGFLDVNGTPFDYVCRYFAPWYGIIEDPATGSAQCGLGPFWARVLGKKQLYGLQAFPGRGAQFSLSLGDDGRISIKGNAVTVLRGEIDIS